jgi:hypothetical protein
MRLYVALVVVVVMRAAVIATTFYGEQRSR